MSLEKGLCGLTNIGNTCYANATLQALRHQVDLTIYILQDNHMELLKKKKPSEKTELVEAYGQLVKAMWTGDSGLVRTVDFWKKMIPAASKVGFEQFRIPIPHDSHEFLMFMLDQIHEALSEEVSMTIRPSIKTPDIMNALEYWKASFQKSYSPMVELLFFLRRKSVVCSVCKNESITWEHRTVNEICVKNSAEPVELIDLMMDDCKGEDIEEYHCLKCPTRQKATVSHSYWRMGNWVIITLKRNENSGQRINTHVNIPTKMAFTKLFHEGSEESSAKCEYELFSTIEHHGSNRGGHYTSHSKHPVTGKWVFYDDESATPVDDVRINASTYTVMYRKVTPSQIGQ
jgi:ubiquitin carboxyl-terminal hydrolase 8